MSFSFDATAGASQSTSKPRLEGNKIHTVKLEECELQDIQGKKDPTITYKIIKIKFSNEDGTFEHAVFEPKGDDFKRGESEFTNKNGNKEKIPQPSNVESMMLLFKHVIDAYVPELAAQIDQQKKTIAAPDWDSLRKVVKKMIDMGNGKESKIKLLKNSKTGEAVFPGFFTALNKDGKAYIRNNFIGEKIAFSPYEIARITKEQTAKPSDMSSHENSNLETNVTSGSEDNLDLEFNVDDL